MIKRQLLLNSSSKLKTGGKSNSNLTVFRKCWNESEFIIDFVKNYSSMQIKLQNQGEEVQFTSTRKIGMCEGARKW